MDGQQLDLHPTLQEEATIMFGQRPLSDGWPGQDAMLFYFQRRPHPEHKKSLGAYGACTLDERSLRALAEEIDVHADSRPFWTPDEPEKSCGQPRKEGPIQAGVEGGPIPGQGGLPARTPADRSGA